jgi:alanyl aminopeptidase
MKRIAFLLLGTALAACKSQSAAAPGPADTAQAAARPDPRAAWKAVVEAPDRSDADGKLDSGRHPAEMLEFLDLKPGMKVADLGAGRGYTTELIARAVGPSGQVYMQNDPSWLSFLKEGIEERFTHPAMQKNVARVDRPFEEPLPPEARNLDAVVMNVIYHDIVNMPVDRLRMNKAVFNALQPGGVYVVIDSSAKDGSGLSQTRTLHRIDESVVRDEVQKAGFKLAAEGSFLRNPQDARDWNSSPLAAEQAGKRGSSDRFALKFVRPEGAQSHLIPPRLKLPSGVRPTRVSAELTVDPARDEFEGREQIELAADAPTPLLWLNADGLQIIDTEPKSTVIDAPPSFVGLQFNQPLPAGASSLKIRWRGKLSQTDLDGAFREQENGEWYALTHLEPTGARRVWPSFDEPAIKVPWRMALRVPRSAAAFFNTPVESTEDAGEEKVFRFAETKPLPAYLLAFGVGPFERVDAGKLSGGKPAGIVVTKGKTTWARYSAESTPKLMSILEEYFQVPYHYPKLDLIEVPLGTGAMENPGLITFNQRINLAKPGQESPQFRMRAADVEAHEFAHLWFGDMVTTAWWDDIWLNEAFATWATFKAIGRFAPAWGAPADRAMSMDNAMLADRLLSARRIRQPIDSEGDIKTAFDSITYQKGAAVIGMFEQWVGEEKFRKGVTRYLKEHADGNATAKEFLASISAEAGKDVAPAFSTFLDQGGLPLVTSKLVCEGGKGRLELSQSRYLPLGAARPPREQVWQIPVCARTAAGRACMLLTAKTGALDLGACAEWALPNAGGAGYYRSALDEANATRLTQAAGKLEAPERLVLFSDLNAAAAAGAMDISRNFQLVQALSGDKDWHVVKSLVAPVIAARQQGLFPDELFPKYSAFVRDAFGKRARALGFEEKKGEPDAARILRPTLLAVVGDEGEDLELRGQAQKLGLRWLSDHKAASPELASAALFLSAIEGDAQLYDKLHAAAKLEKDRVERQRILDAMGHFREPELVQQGFEIFLGNEFDPREAFALVSIPAREARTRELALAFVEKNFEPIVQRMPRDYGAQLGPLGSGFCDEQHAAALEEFFRPRAPRFAGGERRLTQAVEAVRLCAALRARQGPALAAFLEAR